MSDELKACPFCEGEARLARDHQTQMLAMGETATDDHYAFSVTHRCPGGLFVGLHFKKRAEAIAAWNTRADDTLRAENERLREVVRDMLRWEAFIHPDAAPTWVRVRNALAQVRE